ncbi:Hpt domain-containing protein [Dyadobacter luticola]|uniref:Hpt domain-containing protein n=1 Tax=Dyadobacter luticola TaxID=1979387 RepID=A0A5R9L1Z7_9BACT|nr:Hpt domain-containing protein [Dyadobacter luticola]TLV02592.1 Hpt domain-containing protein [Dyadobacter luticola]
MDMTDPNNNQADLDSMIDHGYLNEITGGDAELKGELISMFEAETDTQLGNISGASNAGNFDALKQAIHKYRSSLFSVGLLKTAAKYKEIETALKQGGTVSNLSGTLADLERESKVGLTILKNL